jgi:protein-S-isoprenylcysteine O-methyltransferase Ste14
MNEQLFFTWLLSGWLAAAAIVCIMLFFVNAPYGRYLRPGWGYSIDNRLGWFIMESTAAVLFAVLFLTGDAYSKVSLVYLFMWEAHYVHRGFIYPFTLPSRGKKIPLLIVSFGLIFNTVNAYLNGRYLFFLADSYNDSWLSDWRFVVGLSLFVTGFAINRHSDHLLRKLKGIRAVGYQIPCGGLFRWVSSPNYLGEIMLWSGWALATWSLPGLAFAIWTVANLAPRARANHRWYKSEFESYPPERKALIPGVW